MKYMLGPDWKPNSRGLRFQPRIERALSAFVDRLSPLTLNRIGRGDKWIKLIARTLWDRLAPEMGVALPELVIFPASLWPSLARKASTAGGHQYWVELKPTANQLNLFRLLRGSPTNPIEVQKVFTTPSEATVILAGEAGKDKFPTFSYFGWGPKTGPNTWVFLLETLHRYGVKLTGKGEDDLIYLGQNPLDPRAIEDMIQRLREDIDLRQQGESPQSFPYSLPELVKALIGWEIVELAVKSFSKEVPQAKQESHLEAEWLRIMKQNVGPLYPQMTFLGTEIDRAGDRPQINVLYRGSDTAGRKVSKQAQKEWDDRKWAAAATLSESVNWAYTFNLKSRQ